MFKLPVVLDAIALEGDEEDKEYLENLGLSSIYDEPTFPVLFYHIDHIHEDLRSTIEQPLCIVFSGGESYIVKHGLITLAKMISNCQ
jgi:hypothetical protein